MTRSATQASSKKSVNPFALNNKQVMNSSSRNRMCFGNRRKKSGPSEVKLEVEQIKKVERISALMKRANKQAKPKSKRKVFIISSKTFQIKKCSVQIEKCDKIETAK